ncbi:Inactive serine/threonine-protein kinase plk5 [Mortierella sp. NVP41]|nr:Inactive serine/threonine-protein kinase plk5 [Mortierella sp. NVP41]
MTNQSNHDNTTTGMSTTMTQTSSNDNTIILATATVNVNRNIYVNEFGEKYEHESNLSKARFHTIDKIKDEDDNRFKLKTYRKSRVKNNKTLRDLLTARRRLSSPEVCLLGGQLVKGVSHLHKLGIIHCNLNPTSLFLSSKLELKIGELASAENVSAGTACAGRKENDGYLSPEYVQRGKFTCALDVWATGCILFEMLEGHPPGSTTTVRKGRDAFAGVRMPSDAKELIKQVLEPNPERRMSLKEVTQHTFLKDGWRPESLTREVFRRAPVAPAPAPTDRKRALDCDLADQLSSNDQKKRAKATKKEVNTLPNQEQQAQE